MINRIFIILSFFCVIFADIENIECEQTFRIDEVFFNEDIVGYYIAAFDLTTGSSNVLMFDYSISTDTPECYLPGDFISLTIDFDIKVQIPTIGIDSYKTLSSGEFLITNILGPLHFRNTDLNLSNTSIGSANIEINNFNIDDDIEVEDLSSLVLQSGKIPNGSYMFNFKLKDSSGAIIDSESRTIDIYEPSFLELISPGGDIADSTETQIFSNYPVFSWNADYCSACTYGIRVAEFNTNVHSNLSEAINDVAHLPLNQSDEFYELDQSINVFQYPASNAADLEMGKKYVWQIKRIYETTVGESENYSPIFMFKIISPNELASQNTQEIDVLELIKDLIGESKYNQFFGVGGSLEGYFVYSMSLNGVEVTEDGLRPIAKDISDGKRTVTETIITDD